MDESKPALPVPEFKNKYVQYLFHPACRLRRFSHLTKKKMVEYIHVHKQNVQYCPATFSMVEKMINLIKNV